MNEQRLNWYLKKWRWAPREGLRICESGSISAAGTEHDSTDWI